MRSISRCVCTAVLLALLGGLCQVAQAEKPKAPSPDDLLAAIAEIGKPGAEHKKLEPLVGRWTVTVKFWTDPSTPPAELTGTVERKWILGGRFVQETSHGQCAKSGKSF